MQVNNNMNNQQAASAGGNSTPPQTRGRVNSAKSKVLVRSHAMREEASPPREPTPTLQQQPNSPTHLKGPLLALPSSRNHSPLHPSVVVSPSHINLCDSPTTICISPTATLTPPPARRHSPSNAQAYNEQSYYEEVRSSTNRVNGRHDRREGYRTRSHVEEDEVEEDEVIHRRNGRLRVDCGCGNSGQCCSKCLRNYNNNLSGSLNNNGSHSLNNGAANTLSVKRASSRSSLRHQSSSQGSFDSNITNSPRLSRDNSGEIYTDTTGTDLVRFITDTINKNMKDRQLMLRIEQELIALCECTEKTHFKFPAMSSYQRMMVHRVAAFFGMDHNVEITGKSVIVSKTAYTRIPEQRFDMYIRYDVGFCDEPPRRSILKRDSNSVEDYNFKSPDRQSSFENRRSKSIEEREEDYKRARRRIFNKEMKDYSGSTDDLDWQTQSWSSMDNESLSGCRLHPPYCYERSGLRLHKVHSEEAHDETLRPQVAKSYSFGGYAGAHHRGENVPHNNGPRLLTKQGYLDLPFENEIYVSDSGASSSRLSPSSSGYKTQSQRSGSITPSPTSVSYSGDSLRQDSTASVATNTSEQVSPTSEQQEVVWVQYSVNNAPKGREIIDPTTGTPARNPDGTIYKFDPANVPSYVVVHNENVPKSEECIRTQEVVTTVEIPASVKEDEVIEEPSPEKKCTSCSTCTCSPTAAATSLPTRSYEPQAVPATVPVPSYGMSAAIPYSYIPQNDYMMYAPVGYEQRNDGMPPTEVPVYYADGTTTQYGPQPTQWTQPFFPPVAPRLPHCVVYNAPPPAQQSIESSTSMFSGGPMPVFYGPPQGSGQHFQPYQQNVGVVYANPMYPNGYAAPIYPSCPGTPSSVVPPAPATIYTTDTGVMTPVNALANTFGQMAMGSGNTSRHYQFGQIRGKSHPIGSASSSSNSASPATTVVCGSFSHGPNIPIRTPTHTPPNFCFGMPPPAAPPKQFHSVRASPPVTIGSSRSPTPAEIVMERHRFTMPPPNNSAVQYQYVVNEPHYPRGHASFRQQRPQTYHGDQSTNGRGQRINRRQRN